MTNNFREYLKTLNELKISEIRDSIEEITDVIHGEFSIWIAGNGGSASTAEHFETDLLYIKTKFSDSNLRIKAHSLTSNTGAITAIANDVDFESIFSFQLSRKAEQGDILVVISASGNSANLLKAVEFAKNNGIKVIGMLGFDGGKLLDLVDFPIHVKSDLGMYGPVEDLHLAICHFIAAEVRNKLIK